jgi:hypothetical protein
MTGRLASRAAEAQALLARFNEASRDALAAIARGDQDALTRALDVRDALQHEIDRAIREIASTRARFAPNDRPNIRAIGVVDRAVDQYCEPLEELARVAQVLQTRLEEAASRSREGLLGELAVLESAATVAARYTSVAIEDPHRLDVVL